MKIIVALALLLSMESALQAKTISKMVTYKSGEEEVSAYLAMPEEKGKYPAVIMIHEWWGLNDWIKSMADALASEGYVVLAVDLYRGKVTNKPDEASALMSGLPKDRAIRDLKSAYAYLQSLSEVNAAKIGSIGWCMGGSYSLTVAKELGEKLTACVINYGRVSGDKTELGTVKASVLGIFGAQDRGIPVESVRAFETALKELGRMCEIKIYEDSGHAFMNPNNTRGYNKANAEDAWRRTIEFFKKTLKG
jgi:carboxymethylenebutenolidase